MGIKKRRQIGAKQRVSRSKKRRKMRQKGLNPDDFYYGKFYLGSSR